MSCQMIPKVFHAIWIQGVKDRPKGDYLHTFLDCHPGWGVQIWDENSFKSRLWGVLDDKLKQFYDSLPLVIQKADVARMIILYHFGGVYVDLDFACLQPLDSNHLNSTFFAIVEHDGIICNGLFGSSRGHPMLGAVLNEWRSFVLPEMPVAGDAQKDWILTSTGPHKVSQIWKNQSSNCPDTFIEQNIKKFFPFTQADCKQYNTVSIETLKKTFPNAIAAHMYWGHW